MSQRIELSAANGPIFRTELRKRTDENGEEIPDQKQLSVLNHHDEKLLTVDYSKVAFVPCSMSRRRIIK